MEHFYWYHAVDVGNGLVTPGDYDFRTSLPSFGFPDDMKGMRVLDVGSATGFFAFEFERRGAEVVSVELPSLSTWDILEADRAQLDIDLMAWLQCDSPQEAYRRHLDGPFQFCHSMLGSRVNRCYSSIYDLTLAKVGGEKFDLIYAGDILLHLFSPLKALDVLSGLCRGTLLATTEGAFPVATSLPMMEFRGTISQGKDRRTWWNLNNECLTEILKRVGFRSVAPVGRFSGIISRVRWKFERDVLRAVK